MTEQEWHTTVNAYNLAEFVERKYADFPGFRSRKIRLFSCAMCRNFHHITRSRMYSGDLVGSLNIIDKAEAYADDPSVPNASAVGLAKSAFGYYPDISPLIQGHESRWRGFVAHQCHTATNLGYILNAMDEASHDFDATSTDPCDPDYHPGAWILFLDLRCDIIRSFFASPFRPPVLPEVNDTIRELATAAYTFRLPGDHLHPTGRMDPERLAILGDAIEDTGYEDREGRTFDEVLEERKHAVTGGCCSRFADNQACECLANAMPERLLAGLRSGRDRYRGDWLIDWLMGYNESGIAHNTAIRVAIRKVGQPT